MSKHESFPPNNLPDWMREFANKQLKQGGSPFEEIKSVLKQKNEAMEIEAKIKEMKNRIGLDKIAEDKVDGGLGDDQPDEKFDKEQLEKGQRIELEHSKKPEIAKEVTKDHLMESKDFADGKGAKYYDKLEKMEENIKDDLTEAKVKAKLIIELISLSNKCEEEGNIKIANIIRKQIQKIAEETEVFKKHPGIKKHIDNICDSRKGHIDAPALMAIIRTRPEKLTDKEVEEIKLYIKKQIKEKKEDNDSSKDDDILGLTEVNMISIKDDDANSEVFSKPSKD